MEIPTGSVDQVENLHAIKSAKSFLGSEFLLWLWFQAENNAIQWVETEDEQAGHEIRNLWIDDRIALESTNTDSQLHTIKGGAPSCSLETTLALRNGRVVRELKIGVEIAEFGQYRAILNSSNQNGDALSPRSLQLPLLDETQDDPFDRINFRVNQLQAFFSVLDGLFTQFISERSSSNWPQNMRSIQNWIATRNGSQTNETLN